MSGPFVELLHEHEDELMREAQASRRTALVSPRHPQNSLGCWASKGYGGMIKWFERSQLGPGYTRPRPGLDR
jgi:hypothetical protein